MIKTDNVDIHEEYSGQARWITAENSTRESWQVFRKSFVLDTDIACAKLLVTSCRYHEVYVNGRLIDHGPVRSFDFDKYYDVIDVTSWVLEGCNAIAMLSPHLKHRDVSYTLNPPDNGILCQLNVMYSNGSVCCITSDGSWKACRYEALIGGTAWFSMPLGPEEYFDARLEPSGWTKVNFDDTNWSSAKEIGSVGAPPWTAMHKNIMPLQSDDVIYPKRFMAVELAARRKGYNFRLGPAQDCIMVFMTTVTAEEEAVVRLHFTAQVPIVHINGHVVDVSSDIVLSKGPSYLAFTQLCFGATEPELIIETDIKLIFSSGLSGDAQWSIFTIPAVTLEYPWHDVPKGLLKDNPEVIQLLNCESMAAVPQELKGCFIPASVMEPSSFHNVVTQKYYLPKGGFTDISINTSQPREQIGAPYVIPLKDRQNMLHGGCGKCTVMPQDGMDVHFIVDFGKEYIGHVELELDAPEGTILDVQCFELIDGSGVAWMQVHNGFRYICKDGYQIFLSHYRRGFRFMSVTLRYFQRPVAFHGVRCRQTAYPIEEIGSFECSDMLLNKVYRMSLDTAALCMLDSYVDCPGHEQGFWVGDARVTSLINLLNFGAKELNQSFIHIIGQSLRDEWVKTYWPNDPRYLEGRYLPFASFPNCPEGGLPMWTFLWMLQVWEHYQYGASMENLKENFTYIEATITNCRRLTNERGLLDIPGAWNLIEWGNNDLSPYGEVTASNVLFVQCLRRAADMANALGMQCISQEYYSEANCRMEAINRYCWDEKQKAYVDTARDAWSYQRYLKFITDKGMQPLSFEEYLACSRISIQSNTLALLSDCVPADRLDNVKHIVNMVEAGRHVPGAPANRSIGAPSEEEAPHGIVSVGSPFFLFFSLGALYKTGNFDGALNIMRRDWADMIACGTNTCWETFKCGEIHWTRSIAHAWAAAPAVYLPSEVLGVKPVEPGYRKFTIQPKPGDLSWVRGSVATPYGPIFVSLERSSTGNVTVKHSAPPECELVPRLPICEVS